MIKYSNKDIIQNSIINLSNNKYTYAKLENSKFAIVKKRLLSSFFKKKYVLLLDGYVDLPFVYDTEKEAKTFLLP